MDERVCPDPTRGFTLDLYRLLNSCIADTNFTIKHQILRRYKIFCLYISIVQNIVYYIFNIETLHTVKFWIFKKACYYFQIANSE